MEGNGEKAAFDGKAFLDHLRTSGVFLNDDIEEGKKNDDTLKAGNREEQPRRGDAAQLSDLFEAPSPATPPPSSESSLNVLPNDASTSRVEPGSKAPPPPPSSSSPPPASKPPTIHSRGVSWGPNLSPLSPLSDRKLYKGDQSSSKNQLNANISSSGAEAGGLRSNLKLQKDGAAAPFLFSQRSLAEALRNPEDAIKTNLFETEAEAAILKAMDDRAAISASSRRPRSDTGSSSIFSNVPDSNVHDFVVDGTPSKDDEESKRDDDDDDDEDQHQTSDQQQQQARPLLQKKRSAYHHTRNLSVEQSLFDLTTAMAAIHKGDHRIHHQHQHKHRRGTPKHQQQASSTAEEFAANMMHIDSQQSDDDDTIGSGSMASRWSVIRQSLPTLREENKGAGGGGSGTTVEEASDDDDDVESQSSKRQQQTDLEQGGRQNSGSGSGSSSDSPFSVSSGESSTKGSGNRKNKKMKAIEDKFREDLQRWNDFFRPHKNNFYAYIKTVLLYIVVPLLAIAAILFYVAGNPSTNSSGNGLPEGQPNASASYILLFVCRQVLTFSLALVMQGLVIDFLALNTRVLLATVGPVVTLLVVQSRGWPHILFWWTVFDFILLSGTSRFVRHWCYYQPFLGLFNEENPSGYISNNYWYIRCLTIAIALSIVVSVKRFLIGLYLGRQQFAHYGGPLAKVMRKMLLISEVASLAKHIERTMEPFPTSEQLRWNQDLVDDTDDGETVTTTRSEAATENVIDPSKRDPLTGSLHFSEKLKLMQLLDQWEEPERHAHTSDDIASISAVLRFRKALTFIQQRFPFSYDFGAADNREACIESAQKVYGRLMKHASHPVLQFETLALLTLDGEGLIDQLKAKELVKLFRPDREGNLTMLDFVKSVDSVYKEYRLLQATIENSSRIDQSFETIFNVLFYLIVFTIILAALDFDPLALFLSLSSVILGFAFIIGSASSKYFEGVLFILVRRPYGIGDIISVGNIEQNASLHGALPWVVENVTLFETVICHLPTNERASLSNGSLANSRIINWARSPQAQFHIFLNFPLDTPFEKIVLFKCAIEEYMKARPREWRALNGFRANRVVANENFIEWLVVIQHREAWQQVGQVLDSKANLSSYCQEVARQLDMRYVAPSLPVELKYATPDGLDNNAGLVTEELDAEALTREFQSIARHKHNIRTS